MNSSVPYLIQQALIGRQVPLPDFLKAPLQGLFSEDGVLHLNVETAYLSAKQIGADNLIHLLKGEIHLIVLDGSTSNKKEVSTTQTGPEVEKVPSKKTPKPIKSQNLGSMFASPKSKAKKEASVSFEEQVKPEVDNKGNKGALSNMVSEGVVSKNIGGLFGSQSSSSSMGKDESRLLKDARAIMTMLLEGVDQVEHLKERLYRYPGLGKSELISKHLFDPTQRSESLIKNSAYDLEQVEFLPELVGQFYKDFTELFTDRFDGFHVDLGSALMSYVESSNGDQILIDGIFDFKFIEDLLEGSDKQFFIASQSEFSYQAGTALFPQANVMKSKMGKETMDASIGFIHKQDTVQIKEEDFGRSHLRLDESQLLDAIDGLKTGGRAIFIIPSELSDLERTAFHRDILKEASIDKVIRLPSEQIPDGQSSLDVLFLEKQPGLKPVDYQSLIVDIKGRPISQWENTSFIKTSSRLGPNQYAYYSILTYKAEGSLLDIVSQSYLNEGFMPSSAHISSGSSEEPGYKEGMFYKEEDEVFLFTGGQKEVYKKGIVRNRTEKFIELADVLFKAYEAQKKGFREKYYLSELNRVYDEFVAKFGHLNLRKNERTLSIDPRFNNLLLLEDVKKDPKTGVETIHKSFVLNDTVLSSDSLYTNTKNIGLTANQSYEVNGVYDLEEIARLTRSTPVQVHDYLIEHQIAFQVGESLVHRDVYLSGNIGKKLEEAKELAQFDDSYHRNVKALEKVMPDNIAYEDIYFSVGSHWMPKDVIEAFLNTNFSQEGQQARIDVSQNPLTYHWVIPGESEAYLRVNQRFSTRYSFESKSGLDTLYSALNDTGMQIMKDKKLDVEATEAYRVKVQQLQKDFRSFVARNPDLKHRVESIYNETFNSYKKIEFNGSLSSYPGMNKSISLRPHQVNASQMYKNFGNALFAHDAGSGKTFTQVLSSILNQRSQGSVGNTLMGVPNHMPRQLLMEALLLFPEAKIKIITSDDIKNPERLVSQINEHDWDLLLARHSELAKIGAPVDFEKQQLSDEIQTLKSMLKYYTGKSRINKDFVVSLKKLEKKLERMEDEFDDLKSADQVNLETLNVRNLIIDEAHNFKNLEIQNPTGSMVDSINGSNRATNLKNMVDYIYLKNGADKGVAFATGTPISNTLLELFNLKQYLMPELAKQLGIDSIGNCASTFLETRIEYEPDVTGKGVEPRNRYVLKNIPELMNILNNVMNVVTIEDAGIKVPDHKMHYINVDMDDKQKAVSDQ